MTGSARPVNGANAARSARPARQWTTVITMPEPISIERLAEIREHGHTWLEWPLPAESATVEQAGRDVTDLLAENERLRGEHAAAVKAILAAEFQCEMSDLGAAWERLGDWHRTHGWTDPDSPCKPCTDLVGEG